jgi:hypothetical protein
MMASVSLLWTGPYTPRLRVTRAYRYCRKSFPATLFEYVCVKPSNQ